METFPFPTVISEWNKIYAFLPTLDLNTLSIHTLLFFLAILLLGSLFFSMAETALMAINRHQLKQRAKAGYKDAKFTEILLSKTDKLLGVLLLGSNFIHAASTTFITIITIRLLGGNGTAIIVGTVISTLASIIFSDLTPKALGATYSDIIGRKSSFILLPLLKIVSPIIEGLNFLITSLLKFLKLKNSSINKSQLQLTPAEVRTFILDHGRYLHNRHRTILFQLFSLDQVTIEDLMIPRAQIESLNLSLPIEEIRAQLMTSHHTRLPVYKNDFDNIIGLLHIKHCLKIGEFNNFSAEDIIPLLKMPYFVPCTTPILIQIQNFQSNQQRMALVVDEYGQLMGLITLDDILEELIGQFTTSPTHARERFQPDADGSILLEGSMPLRVINNRLGTHLPIQSAKTLNGLILEHLETIPEGNISCKIEGYVIEIVHIQEKAIRLAKIYI